MLDQCLRAVIARRAWVMLAMLALALLGLYSARQLPIDAVPDITNVQVQINTAAPGYTPQEVEQRVSVALETAMAGLPRLEQTRSLSRYGLSQITVVFTEGSDPYFVRQLVAERLQQARALLPAGLVPTLGPLATGLGEIYMWTLEAEPQARRPDGQPYGLADLRELQDWVLKPQLRTVPGVTEINTIGGQPGAWQVAPDPARLQAHGLGLADLVQALEAGNANAGAGYLERRGEQVLLRVPGQAGSAAEIAALPLAARRDGTGPARVLRVSDVAQVLPGGELRSGAATVNGREAVLGTAFMLMGENSRQVARAVDQRLTEIQRSLPPGVKVVTVYDRTTLVDKAIATVQKNLLEGALLVVLVLFVFLGQWRAALITAAVIPLAMLLTFSGMLGRGLSANLMSLGALDFGLIVDGAVVMVENAVRHLGLARQHLGRPLSQAERLEAIHVACREARRPLIYGQLIIMVVYLPVFALSGVEGKMFHPIALTVVLALAAALLLSLSFVPAALALWLKAPEPRSGAAATGGHGRAERLTAWAERRYAPLLEAVLRHPRPVLAGALASVLLALLLATRLGSEFVPSLDEGDVALHAMRIPGTSVSQAVSMQAELERALQAVPQVQRVFAKIGTAEIATDPMPPNVADTFVMLKPRDQWPAPQAPREAVVAALQRAADSVPGSNYEFTQPIQMRFNELISGVRSDVALKVFGEDLGQLQASAERLATVLRQVSSAADVRVEQVGGLPLLSLLPQRERLAQLGLSLADLQQLVGIAVAGQSAGAVYQGDRRFELIVRLPEAMRNDPEQLMRLPVRLPLRDSGGAGSGLELAQSVPLGELARFEWSEGPNQLSREMGKRRVVVSANVRGRDLGSFVAEARARVAAQAPLPAGQWLVWGGSYEQLQSASARLAWVIPLALGLVLALLVAMFGRLREGLLVFSGVPFALVGGLLALWLRGIPLSISAGVGFIALSGVAVLNGLVMISFVRQLREQGLGLDQALRQGAVTRLRPVLMTALVASLGFVPMALAVGTGAEVQRPLATVVIGGILSSTALTLLVLPVLYRWACRREG
jgi:cobalt-zinc-cadmium resistance protein CzcA